MTTPSQATGSRPDAPGGARLLLFVSIVIAIWSAMHFYVGGRLLSLPLLNDRAWPVAALVVLWLGFPVTKIAQRALGARLPGSLEQIASLWLGVLFQLLVWLVIADVVVALTDLAPADARGGAVAIAATLALLGSIQGMRPPRVVEHELVVRSLSPELDGKRLLHLTDLHLGTLLGDTWLRALVERIDTLEVDLIALTGDILDSDPAELEALLPTLRTIRAPLGVWAVSGNHEFYVGLGASLRLFEAAGYRVLRDAWAEAAPGLIVAGVDDLTARRQLGVAAAGAVARALTGRPPGAATIYLCHSPLAVAEAAAGGADLMLSGHTHGGQIWPFGGLVRLLYRHLAGRYQIGAMTLIVSRGTGTWGPRMRLFQRAEMHLVRLRRELD